MSDTTVESVASPEVQEKAEAMGWIPPTRFKGDPERFIDAEDYIERGETVLPIVKEQNKRLQNELAQVRAEAHNTAVALAAAQDAIGQIEERHSVETQKAVERARLQVKMQLAAASEAGDHEGVAELTDQLTQLNTAEKKAEPLAKPQVAPVPYVPPPEMQEWNAENPWFGKDKRKTALALGIAQDLREQGEPLVGRAFFDKVADELSGMLSEKSIPGSKVEGARNGSELDMPRQGGKKGYANLPADAKSACDADARQFVGPTKRYKTQAEWRTRYAEIYFEGS